MAWKDVGSASSQYISGLSLELTNITSKSPVYYVSMKAENGAGILSSQAVTSTPIVVVPEDKAGKTLCLVHFTAQLNTTLLAPYEVLNKVIILKGVRSLIKVSIKYVKFHIYRGIFLFKITCCLNSFFENSWRNFRTTVVFE